MIDFAAMKVGDELPLTPGPWEINRPVYEACLAYTNSTEPRPQFEFDRTGIDYGKEFWAIRRIR